MKAMHFGTSFAINRDTNEIFSSCTLDQILAQKEEKVLKMKNCLMHVSFALLLISLCGAKSLRKKDASNAVIIRELVDILDDIVQEEEKVQSKRHNDQRKRISKRGCADSKPWTCTLVISSHPHGCSKFGNICHLSCGLCG